jgi:hypothetical protein
MMKTKVLTAVSAAALLGISSFALAQSTGSQGGGSGSSSAPPANTMQRQQDAPPAASGSGMTQDKDSTKSRAQSQDSPKSTTTQSQSGQMGKDSKSQAQTPSTDSKSQMSQDKDGAKSGSTVGAATSGSVNLTSEQRTTIRNEVLTSNAPRATNINFSVNVGTVVPSTVRVVEVPATIVKIHPRWKGFRYFVYNDEIIIVEPRTLKIVAVLDV